MPYSEHTTNSVIWLAVFSITMLSACNFSEFSYGYALTEELVRKMSVSLNAAPLFPSLVDEGQPGGGYDLLLDRPGGLLFLQFKLSYPMRTRRAKEYQDPSFTYSTPFYRFYIRKAPSSQHDDLLTHEQAGNEVYYAAPIFYRSQDFNRHYGQRDIEEHSILIKPSEIGPLNTNEQHHVAFKYGQPVIVYSRPVKLGTKAGGSSVVSSLESSVMSDGAPTLQDVLKRTLAQLDAQFGRTYSRTSEPRANLAPEQSTHDQLIAIAEVARQRLDCQVILFARK